MSHNFFLRLTKVLFSLCVISTFFFLNPYSLQASDVEEDIGSQEVEEVNSYELFWPMVAGKTRGDFLYPLKSLKEKVRGVLIFGIPEKVNYSIFLATKRTLEVEELLNEGKTDLANRTIDSALKELLKAESNIKKSIDQGDDFGEVGNEIVKNSDKLERLVIWLAKSETGSKEKLQELSEKVHSIKTSL
jgi:hypothetical protein